MHEIGVVRAMLRTVSDYAAAKGVSRVSEIVADCGELSLVIPQYVEQIYPTVVKGTPFADTKLIVNIQCHRVQRALPKLQQLQQNGAVRQGLHRPGDPCPGRT